MDWMAPIEVDGFGWLPTRDFMPSPKCHNCEQRIDGEDSRVYERDIPPIDGEYTGGRGFSGRTVRVRRHFLVAH